VLLLGSQCRSKTFRSEKRLFGLGIGLPGWYGYQFPFRIAQRSQLPTKDAASIDIDRAVEPFGFGHRRMAIDHHGRPSVFRRPVVSHRQAKLVDFAGRLTKQRKIPHCRRAAPLHGFLHASVRNDQLAVIQDVMTHQFMDKIRGEGLRRLLVQEAKTYKEEKLRVYAADALGYSELLGWHSASLEVRDGLHELLGDKSQKVRITAAYSLAKACRESFPEVLANLVED